MYLNLFHELLRFHYQAESMRILNDTMEVILNQLTLQLSYPKHLALLHAYFDEVRFELYILNNKEAIENFHVSYNYFRTFQAMRPNQHWVILLQIQIQ